MFPGVAGAIGRDIYAFRANAELLDFKYALYALGFTVDSVVAHAKGDIPGLSKSHILEHEIVLPSISQQLRIVAKIEELFSELDKGVEALTVAQEQLVSYRQAVLKYAFDCKGRKTRIGDEIEFLTSGSRGWADYYAPTGDIFIRAQNLKCDRLDLTDIAFVKLPPGNTEGVRTRVKVGDVLITITGANVTKTGIVTSDIGVAYVSQHVALCRLTNCVVPAFLYWHLLSEAHGRRQLNDAAYGAGKPGLNLENIRDVTLSLPSLEEQKRIVTRIESALAEETRVLTTIDGELQRTDALRQAILKQAFLGQLVAQNPKDEPASVLLERIKAQAKAEEEEEA
jgi:type I restriction enzyme S subunit